MAAATAAGAGMGVGWLLWTGPDSAASGTGLDNATADAAGACRAWRRVPAFSALCNGEEDTSVHFNRAVVAACPAWTAAELDDRCRTLGEVFQEAHKFLRTYQVEGAEAEAAHEKATALCADPDD